MNEQSPTAAEYWESRYRDKGRSWSGKVNVALERELAGIAPGTALDLGCGEGGDALWLARAGWVVTAVDIAPSALAIGAAAQQPDEVITWIAADLAEWQPPSTYDLVSACFLHSSVELPREAILRRAAQSVALGGLLLVVGHAGRPHWVKDHDEDAPDLPTPEQVMTSLFDSTVLTRSDWVVTTSALIERPITMADGSASTLTDSVLSLRRVM
jgi:SAM-dependent methyltransferase